MKKRDNFDILVETIEADDNFDYSLPSRCVGAVCARLLGESLLGGHFPIRDFLNITKEDAQWLYWAGGGMYDMLEQTATKYTAIKLIRQMQFKYKEVKDGSL